MNFDLSNNATPTELHHATPTKRLDRSMNMLFNSIVVLAVCVAGGQVLAPFDANQRCLVYRATSSFNVVLLDSYYYTSLEALWFADDESIDLFEFPVPQDPVRWELVDQTECRNVWQYCGNSASDILITQFITGALNRSTDEVVISVEYAFFNNGLAIDLCSSEGADHNAVIVEVDDTTGLSNVYTEVIPLCVGNESSFQHDFFYTPRNQYFEMVFRSNLSEGTCVNISHVRVFYCNSSHVAVRDINSISSVITCLECPERRYFATEEGECLPCPEHSSASSRNLCECDVGYQRPYPANLSLSCHQCANDFFMTANGSCMACPQPGLDNIGSTMNACQCFNRSLSANFTCQFCAANYYRNLSMAECVLCPAGSSREVVFESQFCTCVGGSVTGNQENITIRASCDNCLQSRFYWNMTLCVPCPTNSRRSISDSTQCSCDLGTLTLAGEGTTTTQPCFCMSGLYRDTSLGQCRTCPNNSFRALRDSERICTCLEGFRRESDAASLPCFAYIGFNTSSVVFGEGEGLQVHRITVVLSQISTGSLSVQVDVLALNRDLNVEVRPNNATFLANEDRLDVLVTYTGNAVALEDDVTFVLSLTPIKTNSLLIGGPEQHGNLSVVISDDDLLNVGFTENRLVYQPSEQSGRIRVNISTNIGRHLVILIRANDTLFPITQPSQSYELIFAPNDSTSKFFDFNLRDNRDSIRYVLIGLQVATYPESLNRIRGRITAGRLSGLYQEAVLVLEPVTQSKLSESAQIGIICSVVVVCIYVAVVVVTLFLNVYYKRYRLKDRSPLPYPTAEGSGTEDEVEEVEMAKFRESMEEVDQKGFCHIQSWS